MMRRLECFIKVPRLYIYRDGTICNTGPGESFSPKVTREHSCRGAVRGAL